jgi:hypothetical protein
MRRDARQAARLHGNEAQDTEEFLLVPLWPMVNAMRSWEDHPVPDAQTRQKMLNVGNNLEGIPLSHPSKFGIRHNLYKIDNVAHGHPYIC